jgi:hypothetical protein
MRKLLAACLLAVASLVWSAAAQAQSTAPVVLPEGCGTASFVTSSGYPTIDTSGKLCVNATVTATATFALTAASTLPTLTAGPGAAGYESLSGGQYVQPIFGTTPVDSTHGLPVNCITGCTGGGGGGGAITMASGAVASGAYSAGSFAAGALVAGALVDGADVTEGSKGDTAYTGSGSASAIALLKGIYASINSAIGAGSNYIGQVGLWSSLSNYVNGTTAAMTGTSSTQVIAAVTSKSIYVTKVSCENSSSTGTFVSIQDGSGGTTLATLAAGATFGGQVEQAGGTPMFHTTSGNGLFAADVTTGANVICNASGWAQ